MIIFIVRQYLSLQFSTCFNIRSQLQAVTIKHKKGRYVELCSGKRGLLKDMLWFYKF